MNSDPLGNAPDYLSVSGVVGAIANMLITFGTSLINLADNLIKAGIKLVCDLVSGAVAAINAAVNAIQNAFNAFVTWAKAIIDEMIDATIGPLISSIQNAIDSYCGNILSAVLLIEEEYRSTGQAFAGSINMLIDAIFGDLFWVMIGVVAAISVAIIAMKVVTMGVGSLLSYATSSLASTLIVSALGAAVATIGLVALAPDLAEWLVDVIVGEGGSVSPGSMTAWAIDLACGILDMAFAGALLAIHGLPSNIISGAWIGLVAGMLSIVMSTYATAYNSVFFDVFGLALGGYALFNTLKEKNEVENMLDPSAREILTLSGIVSGVALTTGVINFIDEATS